MTSLPDVLSAALANVPYGPTLGRVLASPTAVSSGGHPYLAQEAFELLRDGVPMLLAAGRTTLRQLAAVDAALVQAPLPDPARDSARRAIEVVRTMINTAAVTAPPDLWLLRQVLDGLASVGLLQRLADGEVINTEACEVPYRGHPCRVVPRELLIDLLFLQSRGYLESTPHGFTLAPWARPLTTLPRLPATLPPSLAAAWATVFTHAPAGADEAALQALYAHLPPTPTALPQRWPARPEDILLGHLVLPVVLGLRSAGLSAALAAGDPLVATPRAAPGLRALVAAGWLEEPSPQHFVATRLGQRTLQRGPGAYGIIEAYHPYLRHLPQIWLYGRGGLHVSRGANVAASQDANRATFTRANDTLDRLRAAHGLHYRVFIEHAVGCGEATRQRFGRDGAALTYVGADLEEEAIAAARAQQDAGELPRDMLFVTADIGKPAALLDALRAHGIDSQGAVMVVGNGFHEVREQTDAKMIDVFGAYEQAGLVLLFTEESALAVDDLLQTAWNTYHAGFRYVHERSGQGLRPASPVPQPTVGPALPRSWQECAVAAGYVRLDELSSRSRTIYPCVPTSGHNPSISVNHVCLPGALARQLGLA